MLATSGSLFLLCLVCLLAVSRAHLRRPSLLGVTPFNRQTFLQHSSKGTSTLPASHSYSLALVRGGEISELDNHSSSQQGPVPPSHMSLKRNLLGLWGVTQVVYTLANAIKRLLPIALQPFRDPTGMTSAHWTMMVLWSLFMVYSEGYRAFQLKFSPMVVSRAFALSDNPGILNWLLAGPYSMGMFNAERKRIIVAWAVSIGVFGLVKIVKFLPHPYRAIVDAGVVCGLSYGAASICVLTIRRLLRGPKPTDVTAKKEE